MDAPTPPNPVALTPPPSSNRLLPPPQVPLHVGFVGTGLIGKATLKQVGAHAPSLLATGGLDLRIAACADSKHMILASSADGMNPDAVDAAVGDRAVAEWDAGALAAEALGGAAGFSILTAAGFRVLRLSGTLATSPLASREAQASTGLEIVDRRSLVDPVTATKLVDEARS